MTDQEIQPLSRTLQLAAVVGLLVVLVTEGLGAARALASIPLALTWVGIGLATYLLRSRWWPLAAPVSGGSPASLAAPVLWLAVGVFLALTFITGFFGAPNAWDGLTYHLPRVERWVEQQHLGFWPTSVDRQLWMPPFGGYAILQFRLLTGGDRLAFLPSWLAYLGCILLSAHVCRQLGGFRGQAALAALVMATMPVAVLHASSVQTDLLTAFWVLCAASLVLGVWSAPEVARDWRHALWLAAVVALALLTKATAALALVPWLLLYAWALVRHGGTRALLRPLLIGLLAVLLVNGPHFARNLAVFGDPLGDPVARQFLRLEPWSPGGAVTNLIANLSLHLGSPWAAWNAWWTEGFLRFFERPLGADPVMLFPYFGGFRVQAYSTHESLAGNPMHLVLGLILAGTLAWLGRGRRGSVLLLWVIAGIAAVVLHGGVIRWQPYGARLQLASLVWLAPAVGLLVKRQIVQTAIVTALVVVAVPALTGNYLRSLIGERSVFLVPRGEQYYAERPGLELILERVATDLNEVGCRSIGLALGYDSPKHLLHRSVEQASPGMRIAEVAVRSPAARWGPVDEDSERCALVLVDREVDTVTLETDFGVQKSWSEAGVTLVLPGSPTP